MSDEYPNAPPWIEEMLAESSLITAARKMRWKERVEELMKEAVEHDAPSTTQPEEKSKK